MKNQTDKMNSSQAEAPLVVDNELGEDAALLRALQELPENNNYSNFKHIGMPITEDQEKGENVFRVFGGNPDGLQVTQGGGQFDEYLEQTKTMQCDVTCIYELNLDTTKHTVKQKLYDVCKNKFDYSRMNFSSGWVKSGNDYKPGGTCIITQGNVTGAVVDRGADEMGRWSYQRIGGKQGKSLMVISAYQVCDQSVVTADKVTSLTGTAQQTSMLREKGRSETPRKAFNKDLIKFIEDQRKDHA
jgi:hypothetical protein